MTERTDCQVYWGTHGCMFERGHEGHHECPCCDCGDNHPDAGDGVLCVAKFPYYGEEETVFYGPDALTPPGQALQR